MNIFVYLENSKELMMKLTEKPQYVLGYTINIKKLIEPVRRLVEEKFEMLLKDTKIRLEQMGKHPLFLGRVTQHYKDVSTVPVILTQCLPKRKITAIVFHGVRLMSTKLHIKKETVNIAIKITKTL